MGLTKAYSTSPTHSSLSLFFSSLSPTYSTPILPPPPPSPGLIHSNRYVTSSTAHTSANSYSVTPYYSKQALSTHTTWLGRTSPWPSLPVAWLTRGSICEDLTCHNFTTGCGPPSCICYGKKSSAHAPVAVLCSCSVRCLLARLLMRRKVIWPLSRVACRGL